MSDRTAWTPDKVRKRIQVGMIVDRLHRHLEGTLELSPTQIKAAELLLRKTVPDLSAMQVTSESVHRFVMEIPSLQAKPDSWAIEHAPTHALTIQPVTVDA